MRLSCHNPVKPLRPLATIARREFLRDAVGDMLINPTSNDVPIASSQIRFVSWHAPRHQARAAGNRGKTSPIADLRGASRLVVDLTILVSDLVETLHHNIARRRYVLGRASIGSAKGLPGFVYRSVPGVTRLVGKSIDAALAPRCASSHSWAIAWADWSFAAHVHRAKRPDTSGHTCCTRLSFSVRRTRARRWNAAVTALTCYLTPAHIPSHSRTSVICAALPLPICGTGPCRCSGYPHWPVAASYVACMSSRRCSDLGDVIEKP